MLSIKSLACLQFRQFLRSNSKSTLYGNVISIIYFWIIEFVVFFLLKDEGSQIPAIAIWIIALSLSVFDFIMKLVLVHDNTVMDSFMKTRPVPQEDWDRFLSISQFWKDSNLIMPLAVAPMCFLFTPFLSGIVLFLVLYLLSVFGGFLVMLLKHRGTYQPERLVKNYLASDVKSAKGNFISGIQFRSFLRSKRLRASMIYLSIFFYIQCITYSLNENSDLGAIYVLLFIFFFACNVQQYGFSVEANFFNGIWSRPISIERLLATKYKFGVICGVTAAILCLPLCIWSKLSVFDIVADTLFCCCFVNLFMLVDAYNCVPFNLFGKAFFNNQGGRSSFKASTFIVLIVTLGVGYAIIVNLSGWKSQAILSALGIAGLCSYRPFFRYVVSRFMKNRYKYMEKYTSK